jgi:hypothetical protein
MRRSHDHDPQFDRLAQRPPQEVREIGDERPDVVGF